MPAPRSESGAAAAVPAPQESHAAKAAISWLRDLTLSVVLAVLVILFVYQPVKIGARDGRIYAEVSPDIYTLTPGMYTEARRIIEELGWQDNVDWDRVQRAVEQQNGIPTDITRGGEPLEPGAEKGSNVAGGRDRL